MTTFLIACILLIITLAVFSYLYFEQKLTNQRLRDELGVSHLRLLIQRSIIEYLRGAIDDKELTSRLGEQAAQEIQRFKREMINQELTNKV